MEHLVRFTNAEGRDGFHNADSLDDAVKFVERLRNNEDVSAVRVFRMQEVPIEFKAYYKVEIRGAEATAPAVPDAPAESEERPAVAPPGAEDASLVVSPSGENGAGRKLFGRTS